MFLELRPVAILVVAAFIAIWLVDGALRRSLRRSSAPAASPTGGARIPGLVVLVASCVAIAAPILLAFGGFDGNRWQFLIVCNFILVLWLSLGDRRGRELSAAALVALVATVLLLNHFAIGSFDELAPRDLGSLTERRTFRRQLLGTDPSLFTIPKQ
jgi:hypothetical protein